MSLQTRAFAAQDALITALEAAPGLSSWTVGFGLPNQRPEALHIWVDENVTDWSQESISTGVMTKNEAFAIAVYLYSRRTDSTAIEVRDEIAAAAGVVADLIGATPFLGGVVLFAEVSNVEYDGAFADTDGRMREGVMKLTIKCTAFVSAA